MVRLIGYFFGIGTVLALLVAGGVAVYIGSLTKELPDYEVLAKYEPPVMTRVHASDGSLMSEFARERRMYLPIQAVPNRVKAAFISAEDKTFYEHHGLDFGGLARAVLTNVKNMGSGRRPVGASTITQQVAKNFLLSSNQTYDRKIKEAILAMRIEQAYSKDRILELYLNEIFFGLGAYGIASAALTYFDKSVGELSIAETAYLAALPKGPNNYHPFRFPDRAIERRNWVIDRMAENGYITTQESEEAKKEPLGVKTRTATHYLFASEYFSEEVRRQIIQKYGVDALYEGGLSVRTTLNPTMQVEARKSLQAALLRYDEARGWRGPLKHAELGGDWATAFGDLQAYPDVPEWQLAVVLNVSAAGADIGLQPEVEGSGSRSKERTRAFIAADDMKWAMRVTNIGGKRGSAKSPEGVLNTGDIVYVSKVGDGDSRFRLQQPPKLQGALVAMDPHTGRVLSMVGGFSFGESEFNRATQAYRQPGSSFKPFVYAAALDNGYTPASVVLDGPLEVNQGGALGVWAPKNYSGKFSGPSTLRYGIEQSRNVMTVRLAQDMGMKTVAEYAERFGIYDKMLPVLSMALGAGETTVLRMVTAYSVIANGGQSITPSMIDRIQDRYGKTVFKHDARQCEGCNAQQWSNQEEPTLIDNRDQVLDPMTAYQITSMMEGVVQRGTAQLLKSLDRPLAGKTGTTNDEKDAWFVGFTPDLVVGVFMGYDTPTPLGRGGTGGGLAAPVFKEFMGQALAGTPKVDFRVPEGMTLIAINRKTGMRTNKGDPNLIMEAFKPGTGPSDTYSVIGMDQFREGSPVQPQSPQATRAINSGSGGLY
ncbi:penicillin-binding protein 1A [Brucella pituitosa]|uniref:Penicillin-binding protein 1A n=1 Tax=Brucella pituitosa TaxID=571256 RepID=A0A643F4T0_9HYPH|nr:penicillin-binding protein 1A [Brucella pituitosa]PRA56625.1 penicillin-binding protein [Ochrobactrum sp. MYb68]PRA87194.1 penicillin-binding protein [Ochrobactrum sp. MYb29]KAB0573226.1 penicillin-binding protein 1A [Brucella pituitosa]MCK4203194.1 penicillin-binding protein 1A [Brucella pituitosa]PJO47048.1 penicillin-binding protein [Brucella pituitosa]